MFFPNSSVVLLRGREHELRGESGFSLRCTSSHVPLWLLGGTHVGTPCKPSAEQRHLGIPTKPRATSSFLLVTCAEEGGSAPRGDSWVGSAGAFQC